MNQMEIGEANKIAADLNKIAVRIKQFSGWRTMGGKPTALAAGLVGVITAVAEAIYAEAERHER